MNRTGLLLIVAGVFVIARLVTKDSAGQTLAGRLAGGQPTNQATSILTSVAGAPTGASSSISKQASRIAASSAASDLGAGSVTPTSFAKSLLTALNAPLTAANVKSIVDWEALEGGNWDNTATYNPLNTTQAEPGYGETGTQGNIGAYTSWAQGLQATVQTLTSSIYSPIVSALQSGTGLGGLHLTALHDWSAGPNAADSAGYWSVP